MVLTGDIPTSNGAQSSRAAAMVLTGDIPTSNGAQS
jgi:hypothetical protein